MRFKLLLALLVFLCLACGDGNSTSPSPANTPPRAAQVSLFASCFGVIRCDFTIRESTGVAANINWVRIYWPDGPIGEIGASDLINQFGTNVVSGNQLQFQVPVLALRSCCAGVPGPSRFEVSYTDATGTRTAQDS